VASFRFGRVSAAIFADPVKLPSGKTVTRMKVSLRKSYRTEKGWEHTHTLGLEDLLPASYALLKCIDFIVGSEETDE
jgi:hypothetical protein